MECACVGNKGMADVADWRKNNVKQRMEELLDGTHLPTSQF
jgi:hypothetical protein